MADHRGLAERPKQWMKCRRDPMMSIHHRPDSILRINVNIGVPKDISDWPAAI